MFHQSCPWRGHAHSHSTWEARGPRRAGRASYHDTHFILLHVASLSLLPFSGAPHPNPDSGGKRLLQNLSPHPTISQEQQNPLYLHDPRGLVSHCQGHASSLQTGPQPSL